jgi:peptidoglycan/xylan/chitin deacetylase (PgdA/CDA1 family)
MLADVTRRVLRLPRRVPGYLPLARRLRARSVALLMYHGLVAEPLPIFNWCQLPASAFAEHLELLAAQYRVLPLAEVLTRLERGAPLPPSTACLTFDDGYRSVARLAFPVLQRHQLPASVFLVTSLVGSNQPPWSERLYNAIAATEQTDLSYDGRGQSLATAADRGRTFQWLVDRLKTLENARRQESIAALLEELGARQETAENPLAILDWDEVEQLRDSGLVDFGSHTHTHPILSRCTPERQRTELASSRDILRERLGRADLFAYPNGLASDFTPTTQELLPELGYRCALSTIPGLHRLRADRYAMHRVNVGADTTTRQLELHLVGL